MILIKIYNNIINYFKKQYGFDNKPVDKKSTIETTISNSIKFEIDQWNRFILTVVIENPNDQSCEDFGKMLCLINSGQYDQKMIEVLVELGKNKQLPIEKVQKIMSGWTLLLATELDKNKQPCIKPTEVFHIK